MFRHQVLYFSLRFCIAIPTINYVICSDGLHKFLVNVHFNVGTRQNLTCTRYSHVAPRVFQFAVVFCAQCLKSCSCAAESREYIYITYYEILIFSYRLFGMYSRPSNSPSRSTVPFTRHARCTFCLNDRERVIRRSA